MFLAFVLNKRNPALLSQRSELGGKRDLDRVLAGVMALWGPLFIYVTAGLNMRFGWAPPIPIWLQAAGALLAILGSALTGWAMVANRFFYGVFRIGEKGHTVCDAGPYRFVRHPGYLGAILFDLATPLMLDSAWALIPAALTAAAIVVRTGMEDRALLDKLDTYRDYARQVGYRLAPGIW
ncbi:MAG: isoprenylcysteine carboxylmethyltransferase family protein [Anaerolineales bacterium]|nr:isoprenylcysteine carboxylmethyltransferase family protein [Anaerolineales bacterium]